MPKTLCECKLFTCTDPRTVAACKMKWLKEGGLVEKGEVTQHKCGRKRVKK